MKKGIANRILIVALSAGAWVCWGVDTSYSPVANLTERWTNDPAWTVARDGVPSITDEAMAVSFAPDQGLPVPMMGSAKADDLSSDGRFTGDYVASGIDFVTFDVMRVGLSQTAKLQFVGKSGALWYYDFALPEQQGVWEKREIPITTSEGWVCMNNAIALPFNEEKTDVKSIEVCVLTAGGGSQQVRIDNFKVVGPWELGPLTDDEMPVYWLIENGFAVQGGLADLDKDGDGFRNYAEYLAGTDPNDGNSKFAVAIERNADGSLALTWPRELYRTYKVWKSVDLTVPGGFVAENGAIKAMGSKSGMTVDGTADALGFYRVQVEK